MSDPEKTYDLADPVPAIPCWAIYADYDANAPDTEDLVVCAREELAQEVCALLEQYVDKENHGEIPWRSQKWEGFSLPYVDGWQYVRSWRWHRVVREDTRGVCRTVTECLEALGGQVFEEN